MQLISKQHRQLNWQLHKSRRGMGASGYRWATQIVGVIERFKITSLLDYGCGQSKLWAELEKKYSVSEFIKYTEYDPCIPAKSNPPCSADLVTCTDVLEHVEPEFLDNVLSHICELSLKAVYFNIALHAANKKLPDGRNAHLIIESKEWWKEKLSGHFFIFDGWKLEELISPRPEKDYIILIYRTNGGGL